MEESVLRRYSEKLKSNLNNVTQQFLMTQAYAEELAEQNATLSETIKNKDKEIDQLVEKIAKISQSKEAPKVTKKETP